MNKFIVFLFLISLNAEANVCQRTSQIVTALEKYYKSNCKEITDQQISTLKELDLIKKNITKISFSDFEGMTSLQWLRMGHNQIEELPENIFKGTPNLRFLGLSENKIVKIPTKTFEYISKVEKINLDSNQISEISPEQFKKNLFLKVLSIAKNKLNDLPPNIFRELPELNYVNLFENKMTEEKINDLKKKFPKIQIN